MRRIEIVGGGLAGLGLGIALRRHDVPVSVHEAGGYPRHRVCGEFLTSLDGATREALHLDVILQRAIPARGVTWCEDGQTAIMHCLSQPALCLSRHVVDTEMAATFIRLGGELRTGSRGPCDDIPGRILACGRQPRPSSTWVGIKQHFRGLPLHNDLEVHFGHGGYIGLTRIAEDTVNACGLLRRGTCDLRKTLPEIAASAGCGDLSARLRTAEPVVDSFCAVAGLDYENKPPHDSCLCVGDRSALIPPFTGHGMTIALQSAVAVLPSVLSWARGETDWSCAKKSAARAQRQRFGQRVRVAQALHPSLLGASTRRFARALHRWRLLPVSLLYRLMH